MSWILPGQQALDLVLEQKDHTNSIADSVSSSGNQKPLSFPVLTWR